MIKYTTILRIWLTIFLGQLSSYLTLIFINQTNNNQQNLQFVIFSNYSFIILLIIFGIFIKNKLYIRNLEERCKKANYYNKVFFKWNSYTINATEDWLKKLENENEKET